MTSEAGSKIQSLLANWPNGTVQTSSALKEHGYSDVLLYHYRKSGWLVALGRGAFTKPGDSVDWRGGLHALQEQLKLQVHLGGKSALTYLGAAHFLSLKSETVTLFAAQGTRLPSWFKNHKWNAKVTLATTNLFTSDLGITSEAVANFSIKVSSRERAVFEMLYSVPTSQSLDEARLIVNGLTNLRPNLLQQLLEECSSIKVKRLFMIFSDELSLPWHKKLDPTKVDFGKGDRTLVKGGKLHPKYRLTLPADLFDESRT